MSSCVPVSSSIDSQYLKRLQPRRAGSVRPYPDRFITPRALRKPILLESEELAEPSLSRQIYRNHLSAELLNISHLAAAKILPHRPDKEVSRPSPPRLRHAKQLEAQPVEAYNMPPLANYFSLQRMAVDPVSGSIAMISRLYTEQNEEIEEDTDCVYLKKPLGLWEIACEDSFAKNIYSLGFCGTRLLLSTKLDKGNKKERYYIECWPAGAKEAEWIQDCADAPFNALVDAGDVAYLGTESGAVHALDPKNGERRLIYADEGRASILHLVLSPSRRYLAIGQENGRLIVFDLVNGAVARTYSGLQGAMRAMAFNPQDEEMIAFGNANEEPVLQVHDFVRNVALGQRPFDHPFTGLFWTKDHVLVSTHVEGCIQLTPIDPLNRNYPIGSSLSKDAWCEGTNGVVSYPALLSKPDGQLVLVAALGSTRRFDKDHGLVMFEVKERNWTRAESNSLWAQGIGADLPFFLPSAKSGSKWASSRASQKESVASGPEEVPTLF